MKNRIRIARVEAGLTQEELARLTGVSRQAIHSIENGKYVPSVALAIRISRVLGKSVEELFLME